MKKIDAHAHLGYIGGWANVKMDADELISLMDTYEIETTMICVLDNEVAYKAMRKYPGRIEGCVYVNPLEPDCLDLVDKYVKLGFKAIKLQPLRHAYCADSEIVDPILDKAEVFLFVYIQAILLIHFLGKLDCLPKDIQIVKY